MRSPTASRARPRRPRGGHLPGRVRAAEPPAPPRPPMGLSGRTRRAPRAGGGGRPSPARTACGTSSPPTTCTATGSTATSRSASAAASSSSSCATALALPARGADRDRARQLQPPPTTKNDTRVGECADRQQHRAGLRPLQRLLAQPHRGPVHRRFATSPWTAPTTAPTQEQGRDDPPLHLLAQPQRLRPEPPGGGRPGKRCLTRH